MLRRTWGWKTNYKPAMCTCNPESQLYPELHQEWPAGQGRWLFPFSLPSWFSIFSTVSRLGDPSIRKTWLCWSWSRGGHEDGQRSGAPLLWRWVEEAGFVQLEEGKVLERPYYNLPLHKTGFIRSMERPSNRSCSDKTRGTVLNCFKLEEVRIRSDTRKKFFTIGVIRHRNQLP